MSKKSALKKILVVDDEEDILWSLKEFLVTKELQAQVVTARSGEEALEKLAQERIDLVITDIRMPGMSGLELLVAIKNRFPYISVIIMTAYPSSEFKREALLKGGMYFIEKPFDIKVLREKVLDALEDSRQFRGMLTGISLSDVIQIKCMSGVTAALRVTEGDQQGIIFFQKGEIIHALCDELEGEEAFYRIVSFAHGHLDTLTIAELPERTISLPYAALLMEGARRLDEVAVGGGGDGDPGDGLEAEVPDPADEPEKSPKKAVGTEDASAASAPTADILRGFREIKGFQAALVIQPDGELLAQDSMDKGTVDLRLIGATLNDFFVHTREATAKIGLGSCQEAVIGTPNEVVVMGCCGGGVHEGDLVLAVFGSDGNQALGRREMRKVLSQLAVAKN